ncbi:MAG: hypothetical protein JO199_07430, partial [Candidatus Eremiobacteraeota bacterium]|nr:hypothetical protein [Candidatus Eremiobacteraeota bacterium]
MRLGLLAIPIAAVALVTACGTQRIVPQPSNLSGGDATPLVRPLKLEYGADGRPVAQPHIMFPRGKVPRLRPAVANMVYGGGPIQSFPAIYVVFWGFASAANDPNHEATDIINFTSNLGGSSWANTLVQYSQTGPTEFIANPTGELKGTWYDTTNPVPASPTQTQIQTEALNAAAHFNVYSSNADYVVALPTGHDPSGFGTTYCAWHSGTLYNWTGNLQTSTLISYTNLPYMTDKGSGCGQGFVNGASGTLDGVSIVLGHELAESQSDPWPDTGWADSSQNEI